MLGWKMKKTFCYLFFLTVCALAFAAEPKKVNWSKLANYDESKIPEYTVPDALVAPESGFKAETAIEWYTFVRPEILKLMQRDQYGFMPPRPAKINFELREESDNALGGKAIRRQIRINLEDLGGKHHFDVLLYIPNKSPKPVPAIIGLNFGGNHTVTSEPEIFLCEKWMRNVSRPDMTSRLHKAFDWQRGKMASRWPVDKIIERGYAFATVYYGDIYPDYEYEDGSPDSIYQIFSKDSGFSSGPATIAWAWGNSRIFDCLETQPEIDKRKVAVTGHSRLGRTAVLTGALDTRFAAVLGNNAGEMGIALSRRVYGETVGLITGQFPYWFSPNLNKYAGKETELPLDRHQLAACIAPRLLYVAIAEGDKWGDPKGEFLGVYEASKVYKLFGSKKIPAMEDFKVGKQFIGDGMGFHVREGPHDMNQTDWGYYLDYLDANFKPRTK